MGKKVVAQPPSDRTDPLLAYLRSLQDRPFVYLSNPGNAGDALIAYATYWLFDDHGLKYRVAAVGEDLRGELVLFGGGGALIEGWYSDTANEIRRLMALNQCAILPQSIYGFEDITRRAGKDLTIFCRENVSYETLLANGCDPGSVHFAPDLALYLPDDHFSAYTNEGEGRASALRGDRESTGAIAIPPDNLDISRSWIGDLWNDRDLCSAVVGSVATYLARFSEVETDRLHVAILAAYLGKDVTLHANGYYKNQAVFDAWLSKKFDNVRFREAPGAPPLHSQLPRLTATDEGAPKSVGQRSWDRLLSLRRRVARLRGRI